MSDLLGFDVVPLVRFADSGTRKLAPGVFATELQTEERLVAAETVAAAAASPANLERALGCKPGGPAESACIDQFIDRFAGRAYRRPLAAPARAGLRALFDAGRAAGGVATGVEWVVSAVLQSVEFLYHLAPPAGAPPGGTVPLDDHALAPTLGAGDRQLLDRHMTALRQIEDRLFGAGPPAAGCDVGKTKLQEPDASKPYADVPALTENTVDIISLAFACDLTRIASVTLGYPGGGGNGGIRPVWLGIGEAHHGLSHHGGNAGKRDKLNQYTTWIVGQVARLLSRLQSFATPQGGTLLDETLVYFVFRHSDGNIHGNSNVPVILAGGAGGHFGQMGRFLSLPRTNPCSLLISVARAMGVEVDAFGVGASRASEPLAAVRA